MDIFNRQNGRQRMLLTQRVDRSVFRSSSSISPRSHIGYLDSFIEILGPRINSTIVSTNRLGTPYKPFTN